MIGSFIFKVILFSNFISFANADGEGTSDDLDEMFQFIEEKALEYAKKNEELVLSENRCNQTTLSECSNASYNGCISEFPYMTCPGAENRLLYCGTGEEGGCSGFMDFTATRVSLVKGQSYNSPITNPNDRIKDGVCSTLPGDDFIITAREDQEDYWSNFNVLPPAYFYGNDDGVFRMLPGTPEECETGQSNYDPRIRPWYVAASSGPKDVIIILDTSGSMSNYGRLEIMKDAATRVINTLAASDYFAVITFNNIATHLGDGEGMNSLQRGNNENKEYILEKIEALQVGGGTQFYPAFDLAFDIFDESDRVERSTNCHKAILFLTDGQNQDNTDNLLALIQSRRNSYTEDSRPAIFTYSFGSGADKTVPKRIACENDGVWASIEDGGDLADSMGAYYKYFAYGLSGNENKDFVAWVEPYIYAFSGEMGTTASAPVYDRSADPPILVGVVGLDFSFVAMERALGEEGEDSRDEAIARVVERSVATCPKLSLSACQLQSLREYGSGEDANSEALCTDITDDSGNACETEVLKSVICDNSASTLSPYPSEIWNNDKNKDRTFAEKICCAVGEERYIDTLSDDEIEDQVCIEDSNEHEDQNQDRNKFMYWGFFIPLACFILLFGFLYFIYWWKGLMTMSSDRTISSTVHSKSLHVSESLHNYQHSLPYDTSNSESLEDSNASPRTDSSTIIISFAASSEPVINIMPIPM